MKNNQGLIKTVLIILGTAAVVFVATSSYYIERLTRENENGNGAYGTTMKTYEYEGDFNKLKSVLNLVEKDFLFDDYQMEKLEEGAINGMLGALEDPYTSYFNQSQTDSFLTQTEGSYEGVGMYITFSKDMEWPMVLSPIKGSPAEEVGVRAGDYIYEISGEKVTTAMSIEEVAHRLKGPAGTKISVTFVRMDENKKQQTYTVELERRKIELTTFESKTLEDNIGYIQFSSFDEEADLRFNKAYRELVNEKKVKGLIIDIRDNPGGLLNKVVKIADRLVPEGLIVYTVDKNGNRVEKKSDALQTEVPVVVLINENSASASEILAAAVKDHGVGKIVGKTSFGKGLVQEFIGMGDGTYVKLTVAEYYSPNGTKINKIGVIPDVEVEQDVNTEEDEQLLKAIEVIQTISK